MKKSIIYILIFLFGIGIGTLKAQENVQSEINNDQSVTNELLPGEVSEKEKEVIAVSTEPDTRRPGEQIEIVKEKATTSENQETLLPGEHPIVESNNVVAMQEDPKRYEPNVIAKEEITKSDEEVIYLPGEHPIVEVNNSEIVQEEIRTLEEQNTSVHSGQIIASQNDQPEGEKSEQVINYRNIKGTDTQPEPEKSGTVTNYRSINGPNTQPEGEKPDDN